MNNKDAYLGREAIREEFSISNPLRLAKNGRFPQPIRLSERVYFWRRSDIEKFFAEHQASPAACA